jgi:hypothetical protein
MKRLIQKCHHVGDGDGGSTCKLNLSDTQLVQRSMQGNDYFASFGTLAQWYERAPAERQVIGSIPIGSCNFFFPLPIRMSALALFEVLVYVFLAVCCATSRNVHRDPNRRW